MTQRAQDEAADIQGLVRTGYGSLEAARYILLRVEDAQQAKLWLSTLAITTVEDCSRGKRETALQIAFTAEGLRRLELTDAELDGFVPEFADGMTGNESRSRRLGDVGANAPKHWDWGVDAKEPHILLIAFASSGQIKAVEAELLASANVAGCKLIYSHRSSDMDGREPFGFQDGISQPKMDWGGDLSPGGARDRDYRNQMAAGEVLLGHENEYKFVAHYPQASELGRNGSYIAYRQLSQDVTGFWQWLRGLVGSAEAQTLAERMLGRKMDGHPLPGLSEQGGGRGRNAFLFKHDTEGQICPIGSHIRRANPRVGDDPAGNRGFLRNILGSLGLGRTAMHDAVASSRFHRILRRGRPYGTSVPPDAAMLPDAPKVETGLHFLCLNASLARQFEFVQGAWIASPTFAGLTGEQDPVLGNRDDFPPGQPSDDFTYFDDAGVPKRVSEIPQFVTVKGGAYFFLPGIAGLRQILK